MKKIIIIILLFISVNCFAQQTVIPTLKYLETNSINIKTVIADSIATTKLEASKLIADAILIRDSIIAYNKIIAAELIASALLVKDSITAANLKLQTTGLATMNVTGSVVVYSTKVKSNSRIFVTNNNPLNNVGNIIKVSNKITGYSFTITTQGGDLSTYAWLIINP